MFVVGLTGPSGAGKSTLARGLAGEGIPVLDADRIAHELYVPGSPLVRRLAEAFGEDIVGEEGGVDRARLGAKVFGDEESLARLGAIVHPLLLRELERRIDAHREQGVRVLVIEAALLVRWGRLPFVDLVVGVTAPRAVRRSRLLAGGLSPEAVERRLDAQMTDAELAGAVDLLILNDGSVEDLAGRVTLLARELARRADDTTPR